MKSKTIEPLFELCELLKKSLILSLFKMGVPQSDIGKKLHINTKSVNDFLKGIKKEDHE